MEKKKRKRVSIGMHHINSSFEPNFLKEKRKNKDWRWPCEELAIKPRICMHLLWKRLGEGSLFSCQLLLI